MNLNDATFGIELELTLPLTHSIRVGAYHAGAPVEGLPAGWTAMHDGSLHAASGMYAVEIVSPVLRGVDGLRQIVQVCQTLNLWGAKVNESCGFHVHIGFDRTNRDALKRLIALVARNERGIWAATGTRRREQSRFCAGIREDFRTVNCDALERSHAACNRYHVLNVSNLAHGDKPTVEFRAFAGTVNATKIISYVRLCLAFIERALTDNRAAKYDSKANGRFGETSGTAALRRMLYEIGWVIGWQKRPYGALAIDSEPLPTLEQSKSELRRLARKYDESRNSGEL